MEFKYNIKINLYDFFVSIANKFFKKSKNKKSILKPEDIDLKLFYQEIILPKLNLLFLQKLITDFIFIDDTLYIKTMDETIHDVLNHLQIEPKKEYLYLYVIKRNKLLLLNLKEKILESKQKALSQSEWIKKSNITGLSIKYLKNFMKKRNKIKEQYFLPEEFTENIPNNSITLDTPKFTNFIRSYLHFLSCKNFTDKEKKILNEIIVDIFTSGENDRDIVSLKFNLDPDKHDFLIKRDLIIRLPDNKASLLPLLGNIFKIEQNNVHKKDLILSSLYDELTNEFGIKTLDGYREDLLYDLYCVRNIKNAITLYEEIINKNLPVIIYKEAKYYYNDKPDFELPQNNIIDDYLSIFYRDIKGNFLKKKEDKYYFLVNSNFFIYFPFLFLYKNFRLIDAEIYKYFYMLFIEGGIVKNYILRDEITYEILRYIRKKFSFIEIRN